MKKIMCGCLLLTIFVGGCSADADSVFSDDELSILDAYGLAEDAQNKCDNQTTVKKMLNNSFNKNNFKTYCELKVDNVDGINELIDNNVSNKDIEKYMSISYFNKSKIDRYLSNDAKDIKDKVLNVNLNLDLTPYDDAIIVSSVDDKTLINKFNGLSKDYEPSNLISIDSVCEDECDEGIQATKRTAVAFSKLVKAASDEGIDLYATSGYVSYSEQKEDYAITLLMNGVDDARMILPKAGFSEHQTGLALDISFNGLDEKEISKDEKYTWIKDNLSEYGFILRYEESKKEETLYNGCSYHIRYVGTDLAKKLAKEDMSLEYYYATK